MFRIGVEMLPPAPDSIGGSITDVNRLRPNVLCSLASCIFFSSACSAARRRLDGGSNCNTIDKLFSIRPSGMNQLMSRLE